MDATYLQDLPAAVLVVHVLPELESLSICHFVRTCSWLQQLAPRNALFRHLVEDDCASSYDKLKWCAQQIRQVRWRLACALGDDHIRAILRALLHVTAVSEDGSVVNAVSKIRDADACQCSDACWACRVAGLLTDRDAFDTVVDATGRRVISLESEINLYTSACEVFYFSTRLSLLNPWVMRCTLSDPAWTLGDPIPPHAVQSSGSKLRILHRLRRDSVTLRTMMQTTKAALAPRAQVAPKEKT